MKKIIKIAFNILLYAMAIFVGVYFGLAFIGALASGTDGVASFLNLIIAIFLAYNINVIVHESGHLVFGLLTGYSFCSFRIWSFMLIKQDGKLNLRRFKLAGTGGQCLMTPPEKQESRAQIILYNLGGIIFNLVFAILCFALYIILPETYILSAFLWMSGVLSIVTLLTNGIPLNVGGIANDGMNALHLSKNPDAAEAFRKTLLINAAQTEGVRISEMPDEWFILPEGADMQNVHCASLMVFASSRPLDRGDTVAAEQQISDLLNSKYNIIGLHKNLLTCDLICCRLLNGGDVSLNDYMTPELKQIMKAMRTNPQIIRTRYFITLLIEKNEKDADKIRSEFEKLTGKYPYTQDLDTERALMDKARKKFENNI